MSHTFNVCICVEEGVVIFVVVFLSGQFTNYVEINTLQLEKENFNYLNEMRYMKLIQISGGILSVNDACQGM